VLEKSIKVREEMNEKKVDDRTDMVGLSLWSCTSEWCHGAIIRCTSLWYDTHHVRRRDKRKAPWKLKLRNLQLSPTEMEQDRHSWRSQQGSGVSCCWKGVITKGVGSKRSVQFAERKLCFTSWTGSGYFD